MKSEDNFRKLLELYFNGSTSSAQEEELRRRFLAGDVPEDCAGYGPLFGYIAQERADAPRAQAAAKSASTKGKCASKRTFPKKRRWNISSPLSKRMVTG